MGTQFPIPEQYEEETLATSNQKCSRAGSLRRVDRPRRVEDGDGRMERERGARSRFVMQALIAAAAECRQQRSRQWPFPRADPQVRTRPAPDRSRQGMTAPRCAHRARREYFRLNLKMSEP